MGVEQTRLFLAHVFAVERGGDSGVLDVRTSAERALLYFRDGRLIWVEQSSLGKTLGAYLVDQMLLTRKTYRELAATLPQDSPQSALMAFMERAIQERIIDPAMASAILASQVERNFVRCLGWEQEYTQFQPDASVLEGKPVFPCSLTALSLQGLRTHLSSDETSAALERYIGRQPVLYKSVDVLAREFRLHALAERGLRDLADTETFEGPKGLDADTQTLLVALVHCGRMRFVSSRSGSSAKPAAPMQKAPNVGRLRLTLPTPPSAEEVEAAAAFQRGKHELADDPAAACAELLRASRLISRPDYNLYAAWAEYLLAPDAAKRAKLRGLEEKTRLALGHDSTLAFGYFVVGRLHLAYGDPKNASVAFRRAVALDPTDMHPVRALDALANDGA